jgi:porphobilinogen deaminase
MAAFAEHREGDRLRVRGLVIALNASQVAEAELEAELSRAHKTGERVAEQVLKAGGREILAALRDGEGP